METLPSCISADRPALYKPITNGEYLRMRLQGVYQKPNVEVTFKTIEVEPEISGVKPTAVMA